jgi:hypothetical protein
LNTRCPTGCLTGLDFKLLLYPRPGMQGIINLKTNP